MKPKNNALIEEVKFEIQDMQRNTWKPIIPIIIAGLSLLSPVLLTGKTLYWGTPALQFVPWRDLAWDILRSGQVPLWNPYLGMGAPLMANYQLGFFYPPNWMLFLLDLIGGIQWSTWGQALLVSFHLILAGWGMARLSSEMGLKPLAQTVSGLAFGLSGYLVSRAGFLSINAAAAWLPWILLWETRLVRSRGNSRVERSKNFLMLSVVISMQLLAGHAQTAWYSLLLAGFWAGYMGWKFANSQRKKAASYPTPSLVGPNAKSGFFGLGLALVGFGLAVVLACALASVQLIPTGEYLLQSQRSGAVDYDYAMNYSFWPWHLLSLLAPEMFGNPVRGDYWGYANYWEDAVYVGLLPFIMAIAAVWKGYTSRFDNDIQPNGIRSQFFSKGLISFLVAMCVISILLALGKNTPVFPWLYEHVWTFDMFQAPARFTLWLEFGLALLAGAGVHFWRRPRGRALYWTRLATAGAFAVTLGAGLAWLLLGEIRPTFIRATALVGVWAVGTGGLSLLAPQSGRGSGIPEGDRGQAEDLSGAWWSICVVLLVSADLLIAGWGINPGVETDLFTQPSPTAPIVRDMAGGNRLYLPPDDEEEIKYGQFFRFDTFASEPDVLLLRSVLLPNINVLDRIPSVNNFDPLVPGRYHRWMEELGSRFPERWTGDYSEREWFEFSRILNLMGVGVVEEMDSGNEHGVVFIPVEQRIQPASGGQGQRRYYWFNCAYSARDGGEALDLIFNGQVDLSREIVLEGAGSADRSECNGAQSQAVINVVSEHSNQYTLEIDAPSSGWLFIGDVWYPGWKARIDGQNSPILPGNYLFRAIALEKGNHRVEISYQPLSFWAGMGISVLGWAFVLLIFLFYYRKIAATGK